MGNVLIREAYCRRKPFKDSYIAGVYYPVNPCRLVKNGYPEYFAKVLNGRQLD